MEKEPDLSPARGELVAPAPVALAGDVAVKVTIVAPPERETPEEDAVPPLLERLAGILLAPIATFRALDARWGWLGPWLAVALVGCLAGAVRQGRTDLKGAMTAQQEHAIALMSDSQRRLYEQMPEDTRLIIARGNVFTARIGDFAGPTVGSLLRILLVAGFLYCAALVFRGKKELLLAVVVAAHAKAVTGVGYAIFGLAAFLGNPLPSTSLEHAANELVHPVQAALLAGVNPIDLWHSGVLALGLHVALGVRPKPALFSVVGLHVALWLVPVGLAAMSAQASGGLK